MPGGPTYEELAERVKELEQEVLEYQYVEEDLQKSKGILNAVFDSLPFDIFALDLNNRYFLQNSTCRNNWGDLIGKRPEDLPVRTETIKLWFDNNHRALSGETVTDEVEYHRLEGGKNYYYNIITPIRTENNITGILGIVVDISELKKTEEALRERETQYRTLAENSQVGFWHIKIDGHTIYINPAMCSMLEIENPEELRGMTYDSYYDEKNQKIIKRELVKREMGISSSYEVELIGKKGTKRNVIICGSPLFSSEDKIHSTIGTIIDITDQKKAEKALKKARDELETRVKKRTRELEVKTKSLEELNTAMKVLLKKRDEDKKELEDNVLTNLKEMIEPYFDKLKTTKLDDQQRALLSIMESNLNEITSPFTRKMSMKYLKLTPKENQIVNLIKHGKTTKQIAEFMNVSPRTIDTHRKNIRKKIGLQGQKGNLRTYLLSLH
jgi:PAS domain S-box-containing protein